jgi:ribose 5-phosphate isomerase A
MAGVEELKEQAALEAVKAVRSGQVLGLGTGSTTRYAVIKIGELFRAGMLDRIVGIPTSEATAELARQYGIPLAPLDAHPTIDLAIDGADEVAPNFDLIKGLGGALLREKAVEVRAKHFIVIVDPSKLVDKLGTRSPLPVEVPKDAWREVAERVAQREQCTPKLRGTASSPLVTDNGNYVLDCRFDEGIDDPQRLAARLDADPEVRAHGLFLRMADEVIVASPEGVRRLERR